MVISGEGDPIPGEFMAYTTLITAGELFRDLDHPDLRILDCRFSLADPDARQQAYNIAHIPHSIYVHLERDLSGEVNPGKTGRHPLPEINQLAAFLGRLGIDQKVQVVAYDDAGGSSAAARLWWLLRWLGHDSVAVLDGGWQAWQAAGFPVESGSASELPASRIFTPAPRSELIASLEQVSKAGEDARIVLIDARAPDRYRGENETIDPVAGHIPGAINLPYQVNLDSQGKFHPQDQLRSLFRKYMEGKTGPDKIFYCGSGVTACLDILAYQHAGLGEARLYPGSWSEWITDSGRPVVTGSES